MGLLEKLMKRMAHYYARECGGISWKWQAMDSKHSAAPLGGHKNKAYDSEDLREFVDSLRATSSTSQGQSQAKRLRASIE
jgi:hypothetical protein